MPRSPDSLTLGMTAMGDPEDPTANSGWPASVLAALRTVAGRVVAVSDTPHDRRGRTAFLAGALLGLRPTDLVHPSAARARLWTAALGSRPYARARARTVQARLAPAGALDGLVQNGGDYPAPAGLAMVTYQDSTVAQAAAAYPWAHLRGLSAGQVAALVRRQRAAYQSAAGCCTFSHWVAASICSDYGIDPGKVHVVGLGSNNAFGDIDQDGRDWSTPRFLFVGFDWTRKNGELVLDAFTRARASFPGATLDLVGGHPRVSLEGVTGHGPLALSDPAGRERLRGLYRAATAFVMPSVHEPAGTVHVEAGAAGIPSIGTRNGGAETCIGPGGYVVDPHAPGELLDAMLALCEPNHAAALGARAREHAAQFTWPRVAERLVRALKLPDLDVSGLAKFL